MIVAVILLVPILAALLVLLPLGKRWMSGVTVVACVANLLLVGTLAWQVVAGESASGIARPRLVALDRRRWIERADPALIALVATTAAIYSVGYMAHGHLAPRKLRLYYANYNLFVFSMLAIPSLAEPTLVWIVVELTTLCSALLVSFENTREALEAAWKYVVLSLMGAGVALLGFLVLFASMQAGGGGTYTWAGLVERRAAHAAAAAADGVPADPDRARHEGRPGPDAHLAAGRAQPGAVAGVRAAVGRRDHRDPLRDPARVSGDPGGARRTRDDVGAGAGPDLGRLRRVPAAASP